MRLKGEVPAYDQSEEDYACGPTCISIVMDYLRRDKKHRLNFQEAMKIIILTMNGNILKLSGTSKEAMKYTIRKMGYSYREISGSREARLSQLKEAIKKDNPVILGCRKQIAKTRFNHYVVLTGLDDRYLYIHDTYPSKRKNKIIIDEFTKRGKDLCWGTKMWGIEVFSR